MRNPAQHDYRRRVIPELDNDYLFEDADRFTVDAVVHDNGNGPFLSLADQRKRYMAQNDHYSLKNDLIEHLWTLHGNTHD